MIQKMTSRNKFNAKHYVICEWYKINNFIIDNDARKIYSISN